MLVDAMAKTATPNDGLLEDAFILLFTGPGDLDRESAMADIVEASHTGYARAAFSPGDPFISSDGRYKVHGSTVVYQPTDALNPEVVVGWGLASANVAGNLWAFEYFLTPVQLQKVTDQLTLVPEFALPIGQSMGDADYET